MSTETTKNRKEVLLGYEVGTGNTIYVTPSHLIATGITQKSGKTTTLEALIKRSGKRAIVFKTKVGETGFNEGLVVPPYFKERSDWQYVSSLLEATLREKLKFERAWIIKVCKNTDSLLDVKTNIDKQLAEAKLNQLSRNIYTTLQAYFELILPQLQYAKFAKTLTLHNGINIMDLEVYPEEIQSLIIRSVLETVLTDFKNVIVVMPEAWKFLPQGRGSPCKRATEAFIRQGATNGNFLWIDSQDMAGVDKTSLKQVSTWILGLQLERNEVKHTLDQLPLPRKMKPKEEEIMTLSIGHFIIATPKQTTQVYVQPSWLDDETAKNIALGNVDVSNIEKPESLVTIQINGDSPKALPDAEARKFYARIKEDIIEIRKDFFNKIAQLSNIVDAQGKVIMDLKMQKQQINIEELTSVIMQKLPIPRKQELIDEIVKRIPKMTGTITYEVEPLEALQKQFQEDVKTQIYGYIRGLDEEQKTIIKYLEALGKGSNLTDIIAKALFGNTTSGGTRKRVMDKINEMNSLELVRKERNSSIYANLKPKITKHMEPFNATPEEIDQVYNHIIAEMIS